METLPLAFCSREAESFVSRWLLILTWTFPFLLYLLLLLSLFKREQCLCGVVGLSPLQRRILFPQLRGQGNLTLKFAFTFPDFFYSVSRLGAYYPSISNLWANSLPPTPVWSLWWPRIWLHLSSGGAARGLVRVASRPKSGTSTGQLGAPQAGRWVVTCLSPTAWWSRTHEWISFSTRSSRFDKTFEIFQRR